MQHPIPADHQRLNSVSELVEIAGQTPASTVLIPGGSRVEDLRLVEAAQDHGILNRVILVGDQGKIQQAIAECNFDIKQSDILHAESDEAVAQTTVQRIKAGDVDIVLKGNISTPVINRHMLALAERPTVTLASIFDADAIAGGRPMILTDAGVTTVCNLGRMIDMVHNAVDVAHTVMGLDCPKVAILSANEKQVPSLKSTWIGLELAKRQWDDCVVCGPLSFDLATSPESVAVKGMPQLPNAEVVAGQADILVCPGIDAANILYKAIAALAKYGQASIAGITLGFPIPYVILSRSDALDTRLESIALCSIYQQRSEQSKSKPVAVAALAKTHYRILTVNPGFTSIKVAVFDNETCVDNLESPLDPCADKPLADRLKAIETAKQNICAHLEKQGLSGFNAISAWGGFLPRLETKLASGVYLLAQMEQGELKVEQDIIKALLEYPEKAHMSNLGAPIAAELARHFQVPAYCVDPVVVDEFEPVAEISGYQGITRKSTGHILSVRMAARRAAQASGRPLEDIDLVVAHLGEGITVATLKKGKITDNTTDLLGEGPFTPCSAGQLPLGELIDLCYNDRFTQDELLQELTLNGGLRSYLGEHDMTIVEKRIKQGDAQAQLVIDALIYQISKHIGGAFAATGCTAEAIVLTGGLVRSPLIRTPLRKKVGRLAPVVVYPDALEMEALAQGVIDVLGDQVQPHQYSFTQSI